MANLHSIHHHGRNGGPFSTNNPEQLPPELLLQRRPSEDTCEELTKDQDQAPRSARGAGNPKLEQVALWLFIVAIAIISLMAAYLLWAKLSFRSPS